MDRQHTQQIQTLTRTLICYLLPTNCYLLPTTNSLSMSCGSYQSRVFRATLCIAPKHIGFLIGPRGSVIKGLQRKYGIRSKILQKECEYKLSGPEESVNSAIADIRRHIQWINSLEDKPKKSKLQKTSSVDEDGWSTVTVRSTTKKPVQTSPRMAVTAGRFEALDDSDEESVSAPIESKVAVPEPRSPRKPTGVWSKKRRVTFAHDATGQDEIREFDKNEPPICVSSGSEADASDEDDAYMAQKTSANAWRPSRNRSNGIKMMRNIALENDPAKKAELQTEYKRQKNAARQSWADICDDHDLCCSWGSDSDDDSE